MKKLYTVHWIQKTHIFRADEYICSACRYTVSRPVSSCPSCGRIMKGGRYDPNWVDEMEMLDAFFDD